MEPKRTFMSADEKRILLDLVGKYKDIQCKKADCVSASKKKKAWEGVTEEYNSMVETTSRTLKQLRKCWENTKARRKKELAAEKKARMTTGGGLFVPTPDDDVVEGVSNAIDIELSDASDNETITVEAAGGSTEYSLDRNNILKQDPSPEPSTSTGQHHTSITLGDRRGRGKVAHALEKEAEVRLEMLWQQIINDKILLKAQLKEIEERRQQAAELHELNKEKVKLEIELLKEINKK